ncbi:MAG TPA: hypothetical protein VH595_03745 [Verrucomicrobiae bacterium]|nr:hypothetical protein [Verrucomicrobiae bacterium]
MKTTRSTILKSVVPALLFLGLCGCGPGYTFSPYEGAQQNWTTGPGGYVKVVDKATLYPPGQYPPRPYAIIGAVSTDSEDNLAKAVREQHADAALISNENTFRNGSVVVATGGVVWGEPLRKTVITANLIRFR